MTRDVLEMPNAHLDEGTLVRRLDGELEPAETRPVEAHLATCDRCREEMEAIGALSRRVSTALPLVDPEIPGANAAEPAVARRPERSAWPGTGLWRAAAVLAFLAGLALAIAPVRAWIAGHLGLRADRDATELRVSAETSDALIPVDPSVRVAFIPTGERFRIVLAAPQREGALLLSAAAGDTASGEVVGADDADLLVLPDGLGIRNHAFSTADYRVSVPADLEAVEVRVAGRVVWDGTPMQLGGGVRIDLRIDEEPTSDR